MIFHSSTYDAVWIRANVKCIHFSWRSWKTFFLFFHEKRRNFLPAIFSLSKYLNSYVFTKNIFFFSLVSAECYFSSYNACDAKCPDKVTCALFNAEFSRHQSLFFLLLLRMSSALRLAIIDFSCRVFLTSVVNQT